MAGFRIPHISLGLIARAAAVMVGLMIVILGWYRGTPSVFDASRHTAEMRSVGCGTVLVVDLSVGLIVFADWISDFTAVHDERPVSPGWLIALLGWLFLLGIAYAVLGLDGS